MTQTSPPGWHPDPAGPTPGQPPLLRYWDGTAWTEHVAPTYPPVQPFGPPARPYAGGAPAPTTPDGQPLAGWWWRVLAYVIDLVLLGIVGNLVSLRTQLDLQRDLRALDDQLQRRLDANPDDTRALGDFLSGLLDAFQSHALMLFLPALLLVVVYQGGMLRWKGATLGKLACGLRVRTWEAPGRLPWSAIAIRVVVQSVLVSLLSMIGVASGSIGLLVLLLLVAWVFQLLDQLWPLWDRRRQALHDKAAGTCVVRVR